MLVTTIAILGCSMGLGPVVDKAPTPTQFLGYVEKALDSPEMAQVLATKGVSRRSSLAERMSKHGLQVPAGQRVQYFSVGKITGVEWASEPVVFGGGHAGGGGSGGNWLISQVRPSLGGGSPNPKTTLSAFYSAVGAALDSPSVGFALSQRKVAENLTSNAETLFRQAGIRLPVGTTVRSSSSREEIVLVFEKDVTMRTALFVDSAVRVGRAPIVTATVKLVMPKPQ